MQDHIRALLELHDVNQQRQILIKQRKQREAQVQEAEAALAAATAAREAAERERDDMDALIRQYQEDKRRCEATIAELREQQMQAKTNKDYLHCINGIENAKSEMKVRDESLQELESRVDERQAAVEEAKSAEEQARQKVEEVRKSIEQAAEQQASEEELQRIYNEKKQGIDPKFLETYERLINANHPMPMMRVDARTRATPMGNMINTQALEQLRLGHLVTDASTNAILYVVEEQEEEAK